MAHAHGHGIAAAEKRAQGIQQQYKLRYDCDVSKLSPAIAAKWTPLDFDEQSQQFVNIDNNSLTNPWSGRWCSIRGQLAQWVGRYNADGVLNMSNMFVLSTTAWGKLLGQDAGAAKGRLIDVGAGDGRPTDQVRGCATTDAHWLRLQAASFFDHVAVTEASGPTRDPFRGGCGGEVMLPIGQYHCGDRSWVTPLCLALVLVLQL